MSVAVPFKLNSFMRAKCVVSYIPPEVGVILLLKAIVILKTLFSVIFYSP